MFKHMIKVLFLILMLGLLTVTSGCAPKGDPQQLLTTYYQNIKDGKFQEAYGMLAINVQKSISQDDYVLAYNQRKEVFQLKDFNITNAKEQKKLTLGGTSYKNSMEFDVSQTIVRYYDKKQQTNMFKGYVVNESGKWKIFSEPGDFKKNLAGDYSTLAYMYQTGNGKNKDLNQAAQLLVKAIVTDEEFLDAYYNLGLTYSQLARFDDSIDELNIYLQKETDKSMKSNAYNLIGWDYMQKNQTLKATQALNRALELNPNNQNAETNLKLIQ